MNWLDVEIKNSKVETRPLWSQKHFENFEGSAYKRQINGQPLWWKLERKSTGFDVHFDN